MNQTSGFFGRSELTRALWAFRREFMVVGVFSMVANVLLLAPTLYMLQVFDRVMVSQSQLTLLVLSLVTLFFFVVGAFSEWMRSRVLVRAGMRLDGILSTRVFEASFASNLRHAAADASKAFNDLVQLRQFLTGTGAFAFFDAPWAPVYLAVLFFLHPFLGGVALVFAVIQAGLVWFGHRKTIAPNEAAQAATSRDVQYLSGKLRSVEVLEPMGMVQNLRARWEALHHKAQAAQGDAHALNHRITAWSKFVRYCQQSFALAAGALLVIDGQLSPGAMIAANVLMTRALAPIDQLVGAWRGFIGARTAFANLEQLLQANPPSDPALQRVAPTGAVQLRHVNAGVQGRAEPILRDISLQVRPGTITAVLGPSGSGKSTLVRCLIGIWPQRDGEVLLDERPIEGWSREALGPHLGYLPQDVELFEGSIAENIARFGEVDSAKVIAAATDAGLHEMILRFPKGYDTPIGEAGNVLSGGQRQRIGLARALYGTPALVVLDEPNANLDDVGEAALVKALQLLRQKGSAVVLVTHRPGILNVVDDVVLLRDGRVQDQGPRDRVLAAMRKAQALAKLGIPAAA